MGAEVQPLCGANRASARARSQLQRRLPRAGLGAPRRQHQPGRARAVPGQPPGGVAARAGVGAGEALVAVAAQTDLASVPTWQVEGPVQALGIDALT